MTPTHEQATELFKRTSDFKTLLDVLHEDLLRTATDARDTDDHYHRRAYVRSVFAYVEGTLSGTDRFILDSLELGAAEALGWALTPEEVQKLSDNLQLPRSDGKRPRFLMVEPHVKLVVGIGERLFGSLQMRFEGGEWQDFQQAVKTRNRTIHPKRAADLQLSDEEMQQVDRARDWYRFGMQRWLMGALAAYKTLVGKRSQA